jgi:hypothetical protein
LVGWRWRRIWVKFRALSKRIGLLYIDGFLVIDGQVLGLAEGQWGGPLGEGEIDFQIPIMIPPCKSVNLRSIRARMNAQK